jgi:hypothetical protein
LVNIFNFVIKENKTIDFNFCELNREPIKIKVQKNRILKSELIQWKSLQCKEYLKTKHQILGRLKEQISKVVSLLEKLSSETLCLSYIFRELDIQETTLNFKMKHGFSWRKELQAFNEACMEGRETVPPNAWQFGVQMCNKWSIAERIKSISLKKELKIPTDFICLGSKSISEDVFDSQEILNADYIYEQKKLRQKKQKLLEKKRYTEWGLYEKFGENDRIIHWLNSGESWVKSLMCWQEETFLRHFKAVFEVRNSSSFLQLENFQMFENSLFYQKFLKISQTLRENLELISTF